MSEVSLIVNIVMFVMGNNSSAWAVEGSMMNSFRKQFLNSLGLLVVTGGHTMMGPAGRVVSDTIRVILYWGFNCVMAILQTF